MNFVQIGHSAHLVDSAPHVIKRVASGEVPALKLLQGEVNPEANGTAQAGSGTGY